MFEMFDRLPLPIWERMSDDLKKAHVQNMLIHGKPLSKAVLRCSHYVDCPVCYVPSGYLCSQYISKLYSQYIDRSAAGGDLIFGTVGYQIHKARADRYLNRGVAVPIAEYPRSLEHLRIEDEQR